MSKPRNFTATKHLFSSLKNVCSRTLSFSNTPTPTTSLPTSPSQCQQRQQYLDRIRTLYVYESHSSLPNLASVRGPVSKLPQELPRFSWLLKIVIVIARLLLNFVIFVPSTLLSVLHLLFEGVYVAVRGINHVNVVHDRFSKKASSKQVATALQKRLSDRTDIIDVLRMYESMWITMPLPPLARLFMRDDVFAQLRVAGFNPMSLFRVRTVDDMPFTVPEGRLGEPVDTAIRERRLYAQDFSFMAQLRRETEQKFAVTSALYVVPVQAGVPCRLKVVAICVNRVVVYPDAPGLNWVLAKLALNQNDAVHHEFVAHLGKTHLLVEPFVAATMRQLHPTHPVHRLLRPHFEGTVFINLLAKEGLVAPGKYVDRIFAGRIESLMRWCANKVISNEFNASMPDVDLERRGLMEDSLHMPYREDALQHFEAMHEWVSAYLRVYYKSDAEVGNDGELQAWAAEVVAEDGGRVRDFGEGGDGDGDGGGRVETVKYLARAVSMVIFCASVQHAAVNFGQWELMAFAPAVGGALYGEMVAEGEVVSMERWKGMLTPVWTAVDQMKILGVLGGVYHTRLGEYRRGEIEVRVEAVREALARWKGKLREIEKRIERRERGEALKYEYLRPSRIPQSINI